VFLLDEYCRTDRLIIRKIRSEDADAVHAFKSDLGTTRYYGQYPHCSVEETRHWIEKNLSDQQQRKAITWVIVSKNDGIVIGECCFWNFDSEHRCAEIGYELHPDHNHKGIMTETLSAIISFGFSEMGLHRIEANPLACNQRSRDLLLKLGFREEGVLRERVHFHNQNLDQVYYGLLAHEWEGSMGLLR
jgi:ribosomal-protein-alanine N-acetyltransferase